MVAHDMALRPSVLVTGFEPASHSPGLRDYSEFAALTTGAVGLVALSVALIVALWRGRCLNLLGTFAVVAVAVGAAVTMKSEESANATALDASGATFLLGQTGQITSGPLNQSVNPGESIRYTNVATINGTVLDARVTFVRGQNIESNGGTANKMARLDQLNASGFLDHEIDDDVAGVEAFAEVRVEFFLTGTSTPVTLSNLSAHFYDIDNNQALEADGLATHQLAATTNITATSLGGGTVRFADNGASTDEASGTSYTRGRASVTFRPASAFTYRVVQPVTNTADIASFDVHFASVGLPWSDNGQTRPVNQVATPPWLTPATQTVTGTVNCPISMAPLSASNFGGDVTYAVTAGTTPAGLTLGTTTGAFTGTPTAVASNTVTITGTGSVSGSATAQVTFAITNPTMTLAPATQTVNGTSGSAITASSALTATNPCSTVTYAVTSGTLPPGLTLNPTTGVITGTPTQATTTTVTITATDVTGPSRTATATVTLNIVMPPSLTPATQTVTGLARCPISMTPPLAANFGGTVSYVSTSGIAPPGLTFSTSTGVFGGMPTSASTATVGIRGTGSVSGSATANVTFAITNPPMTLAPATQTADGTVGAAIAATNALTATNPCSTVTYAVTSGTLPPGLTLNASTGAITGTPTDVSTATVTITATDTTGPSRTATATVTFNIAAPPLPAGVAQLITQPVPTTPSTTVPPTSTPPTTTPPTTTPPTTVPPAPVPAPNGALPDLDSTQTLVTENGTPVDVELVVENDSDLVLRSQDFELRLRGNCTTGCTITEDTTGRETIHLDRNGTARVSGFGFLPGSLVHVWIFSEPRYLGALLVAPDGTYDGSFPLNNIDTGTHTLQANGISFDNVPRSANLGIIVIDNNAPTPGPTTLPATGSSNTTPITWALTLLAAGLTLITGTRRRRTPDTM